MIPDSDPRRIAQLVPVLLGVLLLGSLSAFTGCESMARAIPEIAGPEPYDPDEMPPEPEEEPLPPEPTLREGDVLVFTRTAGFRHDSIGAGVAAFEKLIAGLANPSDNPPLTAPPAMVHTEDPAVFTDAGLERFGAIVFLNTSGDILNDQQQGAMERFVRAGGGFVGVHAAADTEHDWPWYTGLVGAQFRSHPRIQQARVLVADADHPATEFLPRRWIRTDEWYDFRSVPAPEVRRLLLLDESSYDGAVTGAEFGEHPIAWAHTDKGGRSFYTGGGHTKESYAEPSFLQHLRGGLRWVLGDD